MNTQLGLTVLRVVLGLVLAGYSLALVVTQLRGSTHAVVVALGGAELVAAILFLIPATVRLGGILLIAVFAVAVLFHVLHGEYGVGNLAIYGAAAFAVISGRRPT